MPDTASPIELFWLIRCFVGGIGVAVLIYLALRDNSRREESGENGAMEIQAHGNVVVLVLLCLTQFIGASLTIPALFLPSRDYTPDPAFWATFASFYSPIALVVAFFMLDGVAIWKYVIRLRVDSYHGRDFALRLQQDQSDLKEAAASVAHAEEIAASTLAHTEERAVDATAHAGDQAEGIRIGHEEAEATATEAREATAKTAKAVESALAGAAEVSAARAEGVAEGNAALLAAQPGTPAGAGASGVQAAFAQPAPISQTTREVVTDAVNRGIDEVTTAIKADTEAIKADTAEIKGVVVPPPEPDP